MPAYLNTLIGFAVVMLVTSPLITILTQVAFGTAKSSREQSALAHQDIVCAVRPERVSASLGEWRSGGAPGAHASLISDSWFSDIRLARWLRKIAPPGALFARFQLATAIRANELMDILRHLASNALDGQPVAGDINKLLNTTAVPVQAAAAAVGAAGVAAGVQ